MSNKLSIAIVVLLVLVGLTVSLQTARKAEDTATPKVEVKIPKIERDKVDEIELSAPERPKVRLVKKGDAWRMAEPTEAAADQEAVSSVLDKLADLEVTGVAATKVENHARLEVDEKKGTHVIAKSGGKVLLDGFIGSYSSGNSMLRLQGSTNVATVRGSIRYAFTKYPREWRDRVIAKLEPKDVQRIAFDNKDGHIEFVRKSADEWEQVLGKREKKIDPLDISKVRGIVGTASVLNAVDFAAPTLTPEQAGLGAGAATVTLTLSSDAGEQKVLYRVGNQVEQNYYAQRDGIDTIFQISTWVGGRLVPTHETFVKKKEPEKTGPVGSPTNPIPVEPQMQQIQQMMNAQHGGAPH
jgi:hypothetical protein